MSANFKIQTHKTKNDLNIDITGDFDGSSAYELINAITRHDSGTGAIVINTDKLDHIIPFGHQVFDKLIGIKQISRQRIFMKGKKCGLMKIDGCGQLICGKSGKPCQCTGKCPNCIIVD